MSKGLCYQFDHWRSLVTGIGCTASWDASIQQIVYSFRPIPLHDDPHAVER